MGNSQWEPTYLTEKQKDRLRHWAEWGQKMTMLRIIHQEIQPKKEYLNYLQDLLDGLSYTRYNE